MITAAVVCPHPPLLLRGATGGPIPEVEALRAACAAALEALDGSDVIAIVGRAPQTRRYDPALAPPTARFTVRPGVARPAEVLPLSLGVGLELSAGRPVELWGLAADEPTAGCVALADELTARPDRIGLLVMGDGSARRGEKAPGYLDARAVPFDDSIGAALHAGDSAALLNIDRELATALLVAGVPAWLVLAASFSGRRPATKIWYRDAPFGVWYAVAQWTDERDRD